MLDAVLFDWGDTLMRWSWDPALLDEGHRAGIAAIGRDTLPVSEPRTTSNRPSPTAKSAMISSGALPKVALRNPPTPGPVG